MPASFLTIAGVVSIFVLVPAVQLRDGTRDTRTGSGVVTGTVLIDDRDERPLRRARVVLGIDGRDGRIAITEDDGSFQFSNVPSGRYQVTAIRAGYVTTAYGATRPGRQGKFVEVTEGAKVSGITLKVPRGAVITGTVLDSNGQPIASATVRALRYVFDNGERSLVSPHENLTTDDRGEYRIFGLAAGEYLVVASMRSSEWVSSGVHQISNQDIMRARTGRNPVSSMPSAPQPSAPDKVTREGIRERAVKYAAVFYPGTTSLSQAIAVKVGPGEERPSIDIAVQLEPVADLAGTVIYPSSGVAHISLSLVETGRPFIPGVTGVFPQMGATTSGKFLIPDVPPGIYTLVAETASGPRYWAQAELVVSGEDMPDISLTLQPATTLSGRLRSDGGEPRPDFTKARVTLSPAQASRVTLAMQPAQVSADGTFTIAGVTPGRYRIRASPVSDGKGREWIPAGAMIDGHDVMDFPIEVRAGQTISNAEITFTDKPTELSGSVVDASGKPLANAQVIVFAADRAYWTPQSRRIAATQASASGRYGFRNLPAGEYLIAIAVDADDGQWFDPAFLESSSGEALTITLTAGAPVIQDLRGR